jgi:DNA-binding transcriptional ArsR family regulator
MNWLPGRPRADRDVFRAVADPTRRATLMVLGKHGELTVTELAKKVGVELPTLSRHLAILRETGLVTQKQVGRQRLYRLEPEPLRDLFDWAALFSDLWTEKAGNRRSYLERKSSKGKE